MSFKREVAVEWVGSDKSLSGRVQIATLQRGVALERQLRRAGLKPGRDFSSATLYCSDSNAYPVILRLEGNHHTNIKDWDAVTTATEQMTGEKILLRTTHAQNNPNVPEPPYSRRVAVMKFGILAYTGRHIR